MRDTPAIPAFLCRKLTHETADSFRREELAALGDIRIRRGNWLEVRALLAAGWSIAWDENSEDAKPFAWRWRRPPLRKGKPGRLYASTGQAYHALRRSLGA